MKYGVGVDLGGTTVKIGLFTAKGELLEKWSIPTDISNDGENILPDIARSVSYKLAEKGIDKKYVEGMGIGVPGAVTKGVVNRCINLGWGIIDVVKEMEMLSGLKVYAENDANTAALGEFMVGSGREYDSIVMVTLGTGIGSGIILDGNILQGHTGSGGEIGHIIVNPSEKIPCNCGHKGCLEQYTSATGIARTAVEMLNDTDEESALRDIENIIAKDVFDAAKAGDLLAKEVVKRSCDILGHALAGVAAIINPEAIILGGGVANAGAYLLENVEHQFGKELYHAAAGTKICLASLGENAGIYGAYYLTKYL